MKRNILNSPRLLELKKKKLRVFLNKILLSILALFLISACLAYISRSKQLNISEVKVVGNKVVNAEMIKTVVEGEITGNYLWFFPKTNIFFYSKNNIEKALSNQFRRLHDVNLTIKDNKTLEVKITERVASYTWCGDHLVVGLPSDNQTVKEEKCYFMDENGYIFDEAPYFSGEVYFKFYSVGNIGSYFSKENFKQLIDFKNVLATLGLKPVSLYIEGSGDIKIFLSNFNRTPTNPYIILKADADLKKVAENLETAISTEPLLSNLKNKYSSLEYIDLRFGNKVYYKFR